MKSKITSLLLSTVLTVSIITGCGNTTTETNNDTSTETTTSDEQAESTQANDDTASSTDSTGSSTEDSNQTQETNISEDALPTTYEEFIATLHAGQSYAYVPISEGENALLVTSYTFDDLEGHQATYEATIFIEKDNAIEKVTTVQSGGTAYPIALTDDNSIILQMRNSVIKGHVNKETGKFVITEESNVDYSAAEDGSYHNYKEGAADIPADSSLFDELSEKYLQSEVVSFEKAGIASDGSPRLSGAVYAAYSGEDLYKVTSYYVFDSETSGHTETTDGITGVPFSYEQNVDDIVFHFGSADDTSEAKFGWDTGAYPTLAFTGDNAETISILCLGNADPKTFEAAKYYDNDNNLYMQVKSFDETSLTGDLYRNEKIKQEYVDNAEENSTIYSVNGTSFSVVSFEEVNKELEYGTDEDFKKDVLGETRFDGFLVKCSDDNFYYALEKEDYELEYNVVSMMTEGNLRKLIEENVTLKIKENCEIYLQKMVEGGESANLKEEYIIGREFKGDNYPGWSEDAQEYYMTNDMLVSIGVIDGELYNVVQVYVP